jgi:hydroxyethylthiazole kinase-like uncharacterized protein yjeF
MPREIALEDLKTWLKPRPRDSHKGDFGNVGVVGGAPGMAGAALLAARAALWLGAGRVYCGLLDERVAVDFESPELMLTSPEHVLGLGSPGCLAVGPGLGRSAAARGWLQAALETTLPLVLDADALNLIAAEPALAAAVGRRTAPTVLTPHPGEAGRLLGRSTEEIQRDRTAAARELAERYRAGAVLKGMSSLVRFPERDTWRNDTGNPGMAAPGMGDVLSGMIAALAAQGLTLEQAAVAAVHLHGAAGDAAVENGTGPVGLTAGEVALAARKLVNGLIYGSP